MALPFMFLGKHNFSVLTPKRQGSSPLTADGEQSPGLWQKDREQYPRIPDFRCVLQTPGDLLELLGLTGRNAAYYSIFQGF